jgi:glyoxylase-like metal-dependent hydrolase (beta-lactamase superfamily II)
MITQKTLRLILPFGFGLGVVASDTAAESVQPPLTLQVYNGDAGSFHVNAVLVAGKSDAVLLDTGFTRSDALRIAAMVLESKKKLTAIYISQADPDFYFGIETLKQIFPDVRVVATAPTVKKIQASLQSKLQLWGPRLGANAPKAVPLPEVMAGTSIILEDQVLEIRGLDGAMPHRSYVWIPSIRAIAGGVNIFAGLHVWTADTQTAQERGEWLHQLATIKALQPQTVIPGHSLAGEPRDVSAITYTSSYLTHFEAELAKAPNAAALINAMKAAYPNAGLGIALDIGAKVNKGEMKW